MESNEIKIYVTRQENLVWIHTFVYHHKVRVDWKNDCFVDKAENYTAFPSNCTIA